MPPVKVPTQQSQPLARKAIGKGTLAPRVPKIRDKDPLLK